MRTTTIRALLLSCAGMLGCSSSGGEDAGAELGAGSGSLALVRLERFSPPANLGSGGATPRGATPPGTTPPGTPPPGTTPDVPAAPASGSPVAEPPASSARVVANAKVARFSGLDSSSVLKLLGVDVRDGDSCTVTGRLDDFPMAPEAHVELLSVGDLSLRVGDRAHTFSPQLFPDLATTASGWFYAGHFDLDATRTSEANLRSRAEEPRASTVEPRADGGLERGDEYVLTAQGAQGVGRFELAVAAPNEVLGLEASGISLEQDGALNRASDAALTWEPEDIRDRLELELFAGGSVLSCSLRDDGQFLLPHAKLALLEADQQASLVLRRVRVLNAQMDGIENAYVRIASTRTLSLKVE